MVGDRDDQLALVAISRGEARVRRLHQKRRTFADEVQAFIAHQRAGQEARLDQDLEAVADAENRNARFGALDEVGRDRRARGDGAAAQIVAIGEAARDHNEIKAFRQGAFAMPNHGRGMAGDTLNRHRSIAVAIGAGVNNDGAFHGLRFSRVEPAWRDGEAR
jgi:hypothetical protein